MNILKSALLLLSLISITDVIAAETDDSICMPKTFNNTNMSDYMGQVKKLTQLSGKSTSKDYIDQMNKMYGSVKPTFKHCKKGQWIPSLGTSYALEYCDFSITPASAAALGACRYRGEKRKIIRN